MLGRPPGGAMAAVLSRRACLAMLDVDHFRDYNAAFGSGGGEGRLSASPPRLRVTQEVRGELELPLVYSWCIAGV